VITNPEAEAKPSRFARPDSQLTYRMRASHRPASQTSQAASAHRVPCAAATANSATSTERFAGIGYIPASHCRKLMPATTAKTSRGRSSRHHSGTSRAALSSRYPAVAAVIGDVAAPSGRS
jgi:hypothetical protein